MTPLALADFKVQGPSGTIVPTYLDGSAANMTMVMVALALFGVGQGLFVSPNSSAIMGLAPPQLTGEAGSVLNVMRFLGISAGIAASSTVLALSLALLLLLGLPSFTTFMRNSELRSTSESILNGLRAAITEAIRAEAKALPDGERLHLAVLPVETVV